MRPFPLFAAALCALVAAAPAVMAQGEVNIYSARHYDNDDKLYDDFTAATGITVNRIEGNADEIIERMKAEGANSPADVVLLVDAGRLFQADQDALFRPITSTTLNERIPAELRHPEGHWFGFATRARVFFYDTEKVANPPQTYADLAKPEYKGQICMRSASNIYSLSLLASIIAHEGEEAARAWAAGLKDNLARDPEGGDTDQIRAVASGQCAIAVANTYYFARALAEEVDALTPADGRDRIGWVFPNQGDRGTHINISGAAVAANSPNSENAIKFLEYLASDEAQQFFAAINYEYPAVPGATVDSTVQGMGTFKADTLNLSALGEHQARAQEIYNELGWK
ncbi:MAG: Fe(3+) ABC transporter substrate-binding protein [Cypionkella sp.]|nr:Fe(3+) ABC transporter substrate-binding protein [Cypionkella sp.]